MKKSIYPLAERMRPQIIENLVGQNHLTGSEGIVNKMVNSGDITSMILWGNPGTGKTTLAKILANKLNKPFKALSAVHAGVKEIRSIIQSLSNQESMVLFLDEIHRFHKGQQDALLSAVESGKLVLIGATTENPSFEVNAALLSRCQVFKLHPLTHDSLEKIVKNALKNDDTLKGMNIELRETSALYNLSGGDGRKVLNLLEMIVHFENAQNIVITNKLVAKVAQQKSALYDKKGEMHYDCISAFIKSIRGSDPNAGVYYLARMIEGGEDVKFIARRLVILASEDIGNANPTALVLATNCFQAVHMIGYPEAEIILSQCVTYLASSPKSNAANVAIKKAKKYVKTEGDLEVPLAIRNAPTALMKNWDYGKNYHYAHDFEGNFVDMEFLPEKIKGAVFYNPGNNVREHEIRNFLKKRWKNKYNY